MFTVNRLGLPRPLRRCLTTTNIIDSSQDPAPVRLGPRATRVVQTPPKQELAEAVSAPLPVRACVIRSPAQVAYRLLGRRRRLHHRQQSRPVKLRQLPGVPPVGLDPLRPACGEPAPERSSGTRPGPLRAAAATRSRTVPPRSSTRRDPAPPVAASGRSRSTARASFRTVKLTGAVASGASIATCSSRLVRIDPHVGGKLCSFRLRL